MGRMFEKRKETIFKRAGRVSKMFSRISKEIMMAVRAGGPSPDANPSLRRAIQNARAANMPKDRVEHAIRRASGADAIHYEEVVYEGYGPHGIALLIVTATDNPTRTVANVRAILNKGGGNLGSAGSVGFQFQRMGVFRLPAEGLDADELELDLIDHGLERTRNPLAKNGNRPWWLGEALMLFLQSLQRLTRLVQANVDSINVFEQFLVNKLEGFRNCVTHLT